MGLPERDELFQHVQKVRREPGGEVHRLACARVDELQLPRVQALPLEPLVGAWRAVDVIAQQGVADVRHVHPYLMRAYGFEPAAYVRIAAIARDHLPVGHGGA